MATIAKAASTRSAKPAAKPASRPGEVAARAEPQLCFHHSQELRIKTDAVLAALEETPGDARHGAALADLAAELTEAGMDYYFLRPLRLAKVGIIGEQSARLAMAGAVKIISSVSRKYIVRMDQGQLLTVAAHLRELAR